MKPIRRDQALAHKTEGGKYTFPQGVRDPGDTKSAGFKCGSCGATVRKTKPALEIQAYSCKCFILAFHHSQVSEELEFTDSGTWQWLITTVEAREKMEGN